MFNKTFLVALVLCACYFGSLSARPQLGGGSGLPNVGTVTGPLSGAIGTVSGTAAGLGAGTAGGLLGSQVADITKLNPVGSLG